MVQDAMTSVFRAYDRIEFPSAYLRRAVVNTAKSHERDERRHEERILRQQASSPDNRSDADLLELIAALPYRQRVVINARYWGGWSEQEIAYALACRPGTVKSLGSRALDRLRAEVEPGNRLQLIGRLRAASHSRPLESVLVRGLARRGALRGCGGEVRQARTEARIGRREHMLAHRGSPGGASILEDLLRVRHQSPRSSSGEPSPKSCSPARGRAQPVRQGRLPWALAVRRRGVATHAVDFVSRDQEPIANAHAAQPVRTDPVADRLRRRVQRFSCLRDGRKLGVGH